MAEAAPSPSGSAGAAAPGKPAPAQPAGASSRGGAETAPAAAPPGERSEFRFDPVIPAWSFWVMGALLLLAVRRAYVRSTRPVAPARRVLLATIRLCAFFVLLWCLARPVSVRHGQLEEKGLSFLALDTSASMLFRDSAGGRTRWETAQSILASQSGALARLEAQTEMQRLVFDGAARRIPKLPGERGAAQLVPAGNTTDLAGLLDALATEAAGASTAGVLLLSDGRHNASRDAIPAALALGRANVPLYVVGLGQDATPAEYRDVRVKQLVVPEKAFIGGRMQIGVEIETTLPARQSVPLTVDVNGKRIYNARLDLVAGAGVPYRLIEIPYVPEALGVHRVTATLGTVPQEANTANNTRAAFFRVFRNKIGVWYVEGAIRKEFGAIRSALETAPNVSLRALNAFVSGSSADTDLLPSGPELAGYRLVILGDLPASRFDPEGLLEVAKFVENGGSLLMIGGFNNFGAGGWQNTPLAPVLPVEMDSGDGVIEETLPIVVAPDEAAHTILKLDQTPESSAEIWSKLPPLPGINRFSAVRPGAHVLLRAGARGEARDLLVVQEYGKGRSAAFAADMTWQWAVKANQPEAQKAFWRNLATWLTRSDYRDTDKVVFADSDRLQYGVGEEARFGAHVQETETLAAKLKDARTIMTLTRLEGQAEAPVFQESAGRGPGDYTRRFALGSPGTYRFKAQVLAVDGATLDSDSLEFQVTAPDLENDNPKANLKLLRRIAALSGGLYFDPEKADQALEMLLSRPAGYVKPVTEVSELWSQPWVLALFSALLSLEWYLRKRMGLV